jgi:hypothetical protein
MIIWRHKIWKKTVELMFTVQTICYIYINVYSNDWKRNIYQQDWSMMLVVGMTIIEICRLSGLQMMYLTSSSLITGESRSLLASPSISTSSSCFSHPNTLTSSLSVGDPPPGSVVGVGTFVGDRDFCTVAVDDDEDDDICRSGDLDSLIDDDLIERSSVVADDNKSVLPG